MRTRTVVLTAVVAVAAGAALYAHDPSVVGRLGLERLGLERFGLARFLPARSAAATAPPAAAPAFVMPVPVASVVAATIPIDLDYAARIESIRSIALQAKVSAFLTAQAMPDGAEVKAGDLIYRLDPRDFQVALDLAKASVERDNASLSYQQSNFRRGDELSKSGYIAKDTFDQRASTMRQAEAAIEADQANARAAQLNLGYTEIHAPFAGRLGRNQAPVGTLVTTAGTVLNTLIQLDPIYVTFNPSESDMAAITLARRAGAVAVEVAVPGQDGTRHKGELTFLDNAVDRSTGTVTARATIANPDESLLPGQYVRVRVHLRDQPGALLVPQVAIGSSQLGKFVFVIGAGNVVEQRLVTLGPPRGELIAILSGVSATDRVITGNLQKIGPGLPVQPMSPPATPPPS